MPKHFSESVAMPAVLQIGWLFVAVCGAVASGQEPAAGNSQNSLPPWTAPEANETARLGATVRRLQQGAFIVGHPQGGHGSAFVISRKYRLLATNAHVADLMQKTGKLFAAMNVTGQRYEVRQVWYHPGVERYLGGTRSMIGRSTDAVNGEVFPLSPDVAVLQLDDAGPDLPVEFSLAPPDQLGDLFGQPIGMLGYPGHDSRWDDKLDSPEATYHTGVISRLTDFRTRTNVPASRLQFVQHTAAGWEGFSGSPLFVADGRVVAINNSTRFVAGSNQRTTQLSQGVRVDCLWELIVYHGLQDRMPQQVDQSLLDVARYSQPDPELDKYRRVLMLTAEADNLIEREEFARAGELCAEALELAPDFPAALDVRFKVHQNYMATYQDRGDVSVQTLLEQAQAAVKYAKKYFDAAPSDPRAAVHYAASLNGLAAMYNRAGIHDEDRNVAPRRTALEMLNRLLSVTSLGDELAAEAHGTRALVRMSLGDDAGYADLDEAIRLNPNNHTLFMTRSRVNAALSRRREAEADRRKAEELLTASIAASEAAARATAEFPVAWQTFVSEAGRYRVEFPGMPEPMADEPGELVMKRMLLNDVGGVDYIVAYCDLNETYRARYPTAEDRLKWTRTRTAENSQLLDEKRIEIAGHPALEMQMRNKEGNEYRYRVFPVGDRMYYAMAGGPADNLKPRLGDIRRFLDSLRPQTWGNPAAEPTR
jgi:S1-C subfamily serine protease/tetratricopeptide (TPR) repeat protein